MRATLLTLAVVLCADRAVAGPADAVQVPYIDRGRMVVNLASGTSRSRDGASEHALAPGVGWSPTAQWFTALYGEWQGAAGGPWRREAWSWLNQVRLTPETTASPWDLHLLLEIERPQERDAGDSLVAGPMLQVDSGAWQHNLNLLLAAARHARVAALTTLALQWQSKTLVRPGLEAGIQGLGLLAARGAGADDAARVQQWGPALFAHWSIGEGRVLRVDGAWLAGLTRASPRQTLRLQARFEFP